MGLCQMRWYIGDYGAQRVKTKGFVPTTLNRIRQSIHVTPEEPTTAVSRAYYHLTGSWRMALGMRCVPDTEASTVAPTSLLEPGTI